MDDSQPEDRLYSNGTHSIFPSRFSTEYSEMSVRCQRKTGWQPLTDLQSQFHTWFRPTEKELRFKNEDVKEALFTFICSLLLVAPPDFWGCGDVTISNCSSRLLTERRVEAV